MVWYDIVILAILVLATWSGLQRGLVNQLAWISALVLCFVFADRLAPAVEPHIDVENQSVRHAIAMLILYVGFSLGSFLLARIVDSWMEKAKFKDFDRHMGGLLGFVKGIVISLVVTYFAVTAGPRETVIQSTTGKYACKLLDSIEPLTPAYFHDYLARLQQELDGVHEEDLGSPGGLGDLLQVGGESEQGGGLDFLDSLGGIRDLVGGQSPGAETSPNNEAPLWNGSVDSGPAFSDLLRQLPRDTASQFREQLQGRWMESNPAERQQMIDKVTQAYDLQLPDIVSGFLAGNRSGQTSTSGTTQQGGLDNLLYQIGDIYKDRETIVRGAREYFVGVPSNVQRTVVEDWFADVSGRGADPDPTTGRDTPLDVRILHQLQAARISLSDLSPTLRTRLNGVRQ